VNFSKSRACVVGIGSPHGNDAAGGRVVEGLQALLPPSVQVLTTTEPTRLLPVLGEYWQVWIVDACRSEQQLGTITRFVWPDERIDRRSSLSGHGIGLAEVLELAETLGSIPEETVIYTIDIGLKKSEPDGGLSPEVAVAVREVRGRLVDEFVENQNLP